MSKSVKKLVVSAGIFALIVACTLFAKNNGEFISKYYSPFSKWLSGVMSGICSIFPFSVAELLIFLIVPVAAIIIIVAIKRKRNFFCVLSDFVLIISIITGFCFFSWWLNYYAQPLSKTLNINVEKYSQEQLYNAAVYYADKANEYALRVERNENGELIEKDFAYLNNEVKSAYEKLSEREEFFKGKYYPAKSFLLSEMFMYFDITGMYTPYTGEANIVKHTAYLSMPFTIAHEYAHRLSVAPESEANFSAFLACTESENNLLNYSAYYTAYVYCHNALPDSLRRELNKNLNESLYFDITQTLSHYEKYESAANEIGNKVNDTYLKAMNQQSGVKSYGEVVDLLIAHYIEKTQVTP